MPAGVSGGRAEGAVSSQLPPQAAAPMRPVAAATLAPVARARTSMNAVPTAPAVT